MKDSIRYRHWALVVCLCVPLAYAQERGTAANETSKLVREFMEKAHVPGMAVSIGRQGRIVFAEGFGFADVEQRVPVWPAITRFRIGSVSKPITALAVAQLYEQGRLDLDAPIQSYVPSFPAKEGEVTTRLLAGHLAGIRHYRGSEFLSQKHYPTVTEGLDIFQDDPLLHPPGTRYAYSSYGWNLISAVVESASGRDFLEYMEAEVFQALGMNHTSADYVSRIIPNRTRYYVRRNFRLLNAPPVDNSYKWAGGGFLSTSDDLVRFGFAHLRSDVLKPGTIRMLWMSQKTVSGEETGYGIGWRTRVDEKGRQWVGHGGGSVGGSTSLGMYPGEEVVIVLIANLSGVRYGDLPGKIADLFLPPTQ